MVPGLTLGFEDSLARDQLQLFGAMGSQCRLTVDDQCRLLALSEPDLRAWNRFLRDGPLPSWPRLPDMLARVAVAIYGIAVLLEPDPLPVEFGAW